MAEVSHQLQNILLGGRGPLNPGQIKFHPNGLLWRKLGGGKMVEVNKTEISYLTWTKIPKSFQLAVSLKSGAKVKFNGFREQDVNSLTSFISTAFGVSPRQSEVSSSGRNWGDTQLEGSTLEFNVNGKQAFEISIADVSQTQIQGKNDVVVEFHMDDTTGANEKDTLMEMSFHIPNTNSAYSGNDEKSAAQVFKEMILSRADVGPTGDDAVVEFESVHILTPRGRCKVDLHTSFFRLQGLSVDFKIQYSSVMRLFVLPKANQPYTFVVVTLDPPIRKGQTFYPHLVLQFPNEEMMECVLRLSEEVLTTKYKDRLESNYKGNAYEVFAQILRGLSGAKVTRPGSFQSNNDGYAVRTSLKAEDGYLYVLEKCFFFLPKPPTFIMHEEVEHVEFERHGSGTTSISSSYFDLLIHLKNDQDYQFRNIQRNEYHKLFNFFSGKNMRILNLGPSQTSGRGSAEALDLDGEDDPHLNRIRSSREGGPTAADESDEEDEDFVIAKDEDDGGSPSEESEGSGEETDGDASKDAAGSDEDDDEEEEVERPAKKEKEKERERERDVEKPKSVPKRKKEEGEEEEKGKKKQKKKDPNAPKRAMTSFIYFSRAEGEKMKDLTFGERGKALGEKWKNMNAEEKAPYEEMAKADKSRYSVEMAGYTKPN